MKSWRFECRQWITICDDANFVLRSNFVEVANHVQVVPNNLFVCLENNVRLSQQCHVVALFGAQISECENTGRPIVEYKWIRESDGWKDALWSGGIQSLNGRFDAAESIIDSYKKMNNSTVLIIWESNLGTNSVHSTYFAPGWWTNTLPEVHTGIWIWFIRRLPSGWSKRLNVSR